LNVKAVEFAAREEELVTYQLRPNLQTVSEKVKQLIPDAETDDKVLKKELRERRKAVMAGLQAALAAQDASQVAARVRAGQALALDVNGARVELALGDVLVTPQPKPGFAVASEGGLVVALDTTLTPDLVAEGLAREFVRRIQDLRKSAEFDIADRIRIHYTATPKLARALEQFRDYIMGETLADEMSADPAPANAATLDDTFDGEKVTIGVVKRRT
jgi:isoleucyl-tRNA synthetase